jgi:condensation domain-containing protein
MVSRMADRLVVEFAGEGSGTGPLSWGQQTVWRGVQMRGAPITLTGIETLPEGATTQDVAGQLKFLMGRHQSLRTRLAFGSGGEPAQVVFASGQAGLDIIDVPGEADARTVAGELEAEWELAPRDYVSDWPVRMGVVCQGGVPRYQVTAMDHLTTDGFGVLAMLSDLAARDPVTGLPRGPVTAMEPLEQARWQVSPAGQRQSAAVQRHWARLLAAVPPARFPVPAAPRSPRYWEATFNSPATYLAVQVIAARLRLDTSPVMLGAFAVGTAKASGIAPAVLRIMVSNRFRPRFADTVSPVSQTCPCVIDPGGGTFDEAVIRAWRASVSAYKHAYFEPAQIRSVLASVSEERGRQVDLNLVYNDRRLDTPRTVGGPLPTKPELRAAMPQTSLTWAQSDDPLDLCHIHVRDCADAVDVAVFFDTAYVSPEVVETMLRTVESATVAAALDPAAPAGT